MNTWRLSPRLWDRGSWLNLQVLYLRHQLSCAFLTAISSIRCLVALRHPRRESRIQMRDSFLHGLNHEIIFFLLLLQRRLKEVKFCVFHGILWVMNRQRGCRLPCSGGLSEKVLWILLLQQLLWEALRMRCFLNQLQVVIYYQVILHLGILWLNEELILKRRCYLLSGDLDSYWTSTLGHHHRRLDSFSLHRCSVFHIEDFWWCPRPTPSSRNTVVALP